MTDAPSPIRPTDDDARTLARSLIDSARHGALAFRHPETGLPAASRIAVARDAEGAPLTLISSLALHSRALRAEPRAALLLGEPGARGDPLTHPRLSLDIAAAFVERDTEDHATLRSHYLRQQPKAKLYVDFGDFAFVRLVPTGAALNGGFGRAFVLTAEDLRRR